MSDVGTGGVGALMDGGGRGGGGEVMAYMQLT